MKKTYSLTALSLLSLCGCGNDANAPADATIDSGADAGIVDAPVSDTSSDDGSTPGFEFDITWSPCSLMTEGADERAECANIEVPLHWSEPQGDHISLFLKRVRGTPGGGQAWFLTGGPGQAASDLEPLVEQLIPLSPNHSFYLLDHRGVGRSTKLRCPSSEGTDSANSIGLGEGESAACLEEVRAEWTDAQLAGFSSTNAAHDVGKLIAHLREGDEVVGLMGGSYGTLWLERYLNLYPEQPSSVVFTAIAVAVDLLSVDRYVDDLTRRWLGACDAGDNCGVRFQNAFDRTALEVGIDTFSGAGKELCPELAALDLTVPVLKPFFGQLFDTLEGRSLFLPIVYRMARCEDRDVAAISNLSAALTPPEGAPDIPLTVRNWGFVLGENIAVSELTRDRTAEEVRTDYDNAIGVQGVTPRLSESRAIWPRFDAPPFTNSNYQGKLLLLHGEYDFLPTEVYEPTVDHYLRTNPNADFVLLPGAPHSMESPTTTGSQCGISLAVSRVLSPNAVVADCASDVLPLAFEPPAALSTALFGTDDPWDGSPPEMSGGSSGSMARRAQSAPFSREARPWSGARPVPHARSFAPTTRPVRTSLPTR
ncbi:MAG: hypothetical protein AAGF12_14915 [Myxococcota bacterium]